MCNLKMSGAFTEKPDFVKAVSWGPVPDPEPVRLGVRYRNSSLRDSGYPHDGRADKNPYPHDRRADKDSYPHDSNNQCIILRLQLSFVVINEQMMLV